MSADNPLGLNGFEFVEFTSPDPDAMAREFERLGFVPDEIEAGHCVALSRPSELAERLDAYWAARPQP